MGDRKANLVVTDPPYNVNYEAKRARSKNDNMASDAFAHLSQLSSTSSKHGR